ncbi:MAG: hypothetical protein ACI35O_13630 [Bacillaceae bacterium]
MKVLALLLLFIPVPFLFHFYEYSQHVKRGDAPFLMIGFLAFISVGGFIVRKVDIVYVALIHAIGSTISILLAMKFIPNDGAWFQPVGLGGAVIFIAIVYFIGQATVRFLFRLALRIE